MTAISVFVVDISAVGNLLFVLVVAVTDGGGGGRDPVGCSRSWLLQRISKAGADRMMLPYLDIAYF